MNLTKDEIWEIQYILKKERNLLDNKAIEWSNDDEDDKSISLMCENKARNIQILIDKLDKIWKQNHYNNLNHSIKSDDNISDDFKNLFI